jgi:outer membrane receptor for ferrienterochelin and colicin
VYLLILLLAAVQSSSFAQLFSYNETPFPEVIQDIESRTAYRFLYREALVSKIKINAEGELEKIFTSINSDLKSKNLELSVDEDRYQVLVYAKTNQEATQLASISGFVVDAKSGERLPFATLSWENQNRLNGIATDESGRFVINTKNTASAFQVQVSYMGYASQIFNIDLSSSTQWKEVTFRLEPNTFSGQEILVQGINFYTPGDTLSESLINVGAFSPTGEANAIRSLQLLPSVTINTALNDGINIRGSASDGFRVLLDGQAVYHQSHLFGLLDAMNSDVLKTSGFYYDITPAQYQAPLGGTLALLTKTGNLNHIQSSVGFSNTATKATIEGPLLKGRSSFLLSARTSYIDNLDWFNNQNLINFGLDVDRSAKIIFSNPLRSPLVKNVRLDAFDIQQTEAEFYDLHAKGYFETQTGNQLIISGYLGSDDAMLSYLRNQTDQFSLYDTQNRWNSGSASAIYRHSFDQTLTSETRIGMSAYQSYFDKEDFQYQFRFNDRESNIRVDTSFIAPITLENELQEFSLSHSFRQQLQNHTLEFGFSYRDFDVTYTENSLQQLSFLSRRTSQLVDLFQQLDLNPSAELKINIGNRLHYFSNGQFLRWSPRLKIEYAASDQVVLSSGYSRNYQFINKLQFYNITSSDFWTLANEDQPPSYVDYLTAGIHLRNFYPVQIQVEGFLKKFRNLRFHELNSGLISSSFKNDDVPWFYNNTGLGRGVETLVRIPFSRLQWTGSYTWSAVELRNPEINEGKYYYADWDRQHQLNIAGEWQIGKEFKAFLSWMYATGAPNRIDVKRYINSPRLSDYSRTDVSISYENQFAFGRLKGSLSIYNVFDRDNAWYSEIQKVSVELPNRTVRGSVRTNVFDLGFHPSFSLSAHF